MKVLVKAAVLGVCATLLVLFAGPAGAAEVRYGTLVLRADGGFEPRFLPKRGYAPIRFQGYGRISTTDGSFPPRLDHVSVEFDHDGHLDTRGLAVCRPAQLEGVGTRTARDRCGAAQVGSGRVGAAIDLAGVARASLTMPLSIFNGPRIGGEATAILHAQAPFPVSETYVIVVPIERRQGRYGYRVSFDTPTIAGGLGTITRIEVSVGRFYSVRGIRHSYVSARCSDYILQTRGFFSFADGDVISGAVFKTCRPRP